MDTYIIKNIQYSIEPTIDAQNNNNKNIKIYFEVQYIIGLPIIIYS